MQIVMTPAEAREKGSVEGEAGCFRRNHWVPVPQAHDLEGLNRLLLVACQQDQGRAIVGREQTIGAASEPSCKAGSPHRSRLPRTPFPPEKSHPPRWWRINCPSAPDEIAR